MRTMLLSGNISNKRLKLTHALRKNNTLPHSKELLTQSRQQGFKATAAYMVTMLSVSHKQGCIRHCADDLACETFI